MSGKTAISWTEKTWNPTTGCSKVSQGCKHCYAETLSLRFGWSKKPWAERFAAENVVLHPERLGDPLKWRKPAMCFVNSMSDLFHEQVPDEFIAKVFAVMQVTPQHTYQILTKRPERMRAFVADRLTPNWVRNKAITLAQSDSRAVPWRTIAGFPEVWPLPGVWLGVTAENQRWADERIPVLLDTPAAVRFVSYEPALGPVDFYPWIMPDASRECQALDWVIVGGESGPKFRPFKPDWARAVVRQCADAGVACFVKQMGGQRPDTKLEDLPPDLRVREWPR